MIRAWVLAMMMVGAGAQGAELYGVTGDGGTSPETLYRIDKTTGAMTFVMNLGAGGNGESIAYHPQDGYLYHASGSAPGDRYWEAIGVSVPMIVASGQLSGAPDEGAESEITAFTWHAGSKLHVATTHATTFLSVTSAGVATVVGPPVGQGPSGTVKGLVYFQGQYSGPVYTTLMGCAAFLPRVYFMEATGRVEDTHLLKLGGVDSGGCNGLAIDPATGVAYVVIRPADNSGRYLATFTPSTAASCCDATPIALLSDKVASVAFVPEPGRTTMLAAGALVLLTMRYGRAWRPRRCWHG